MKRGDRVVVRQGVTVPMFWRPRYGARWRRVHWPLGGARGTVLGVMTWRAWRNSSVSVTVKLDWPLLDGRRWLCFGKRELVPITATQPIPRKGEPWTTTLTIPISLQDRASPVLDHARRMVRLFAVPPPTTARRQVVTVPVTRRRLR